LHQLHRGKIYDGVLWTNQRFPTCQEIGGLANGHIFQARQRVGFFPCRAFFFSLFFPSPFSLSLFLSFSFFPFFDGVVYFN
jgi:hypothetical protein